MLPCMGVLNVMARRLYIPQDQTGRYTALDSTIFGSRPHRIVMQDISNNLILSAIGPWRDEIGGLLLREIRERGCEILDCRMGLLGDALSAQLLVSGNWSAIGKLETALPAICKKLDLRIQAIRSKGRGERPELRPFAVEINAPQQPDLLLHIHDFFVSQHSVLAELVCQDYQAGQTGANMVNIQLVVLVPITALPPTLREAFMDLCDDLSADGILDPIKS